MRDDSQHLEVKIMFTHIFIGLLLVGFPTLFFWSFFSIVKNEERTRKLFNEELYPMCNQAKTAQQIKDAFEQLHLKCLEIKSMQEYKQKGGAMFTIDAAWKQDFYELKANLNGKWQMLTEEQKDATKK